MQYSRTSSINLNPRTLAFLKAAGYAAIGAAAVAIILHAQPALAAGSTCTGVECGVDIGGTDKSGDLAALSSIAKTIQVFSIRYAAPVIGGLLVFFGIYKIAMREAVVGAIGTIGGAALLFLPKIIEQLAKLGA